MKTYTASVDQAKAKFADASAKFSAAKQVARKNPEVSETVQERWAAMNNTFGVPGFDELPDVRLMGLGQIELPLMGASGCGTAMVDMIQRMKKWKTARKTFIDAAMMLEPKPPPGVESIGVRDATIKVMETPR